MIPREKVQLDLLCPKVRRPSTCVHRVRQDAPAMLLNRKWQSWEAILGDPPNILAFH